MSDLKHQTLEQLHASRKHCVSQMRELEHKLHNQGVRLDWIDRYIKQKTPVTLTLAQIEHKLGHRVIIKGD